MQAITSDFDFMQASCSLQFKLSTSFYRNTLTFRYFLLSFSFSFSFIAAYAGFWNPQHEERGKSKAATRGTFFWFFGHFIPPFFCTVLFCCHRQVSHCISSFKHMSLPDWRISTPHLISLNNRKCPLSPCFFATFIIVVVVVVMYALAESPFLCCNAKNEHWDFSLGFLVCVGGNNK